MSRVSLSFLVDSMDKRRGGCAPNIAYTLALLGERPRLMATAGQDFDEYRRVARGGRRRHVARARCRRQVHRLVLLQHRHREQPDCLVLHRRDGQRRRAVVPDRAGLRAGDHFAERSRRRWCSTRKSAARSACRSSGIPGQQCARMSGDELRDGIAGAAMVICNDYEFELIRQKTGLDEDGVLEQRRRSSSPGGRTAARSTQGRHAWTCRPCRRTESSIRPASAMRSAAAS